MLKIVTSIVDIVSFQDNIVFSNHFNSCPKAIALGNFDGIHKGHQKVIEPIFKTELSQDISPCLVTFIPHPQEFFSGEQKKLLTPILEKSILLEKLGIKELILLPFDHELANLTPQEFVLEILIKKINAVFISIGEVFRFGYKWQGNAQDLKLIAHQHNVRVNITTERKILLCKKLRRVSSSHIRNCLDEGKITFANQMLGREYQLIGKVIQGKQLGRTIGFPTANLEIPAEKFLPQNGVYAVTVNLPNTHHINIPAVMNIGNRPTVNGQNTSVEVHLLDWQEDLYGQILLVKLVHFLRPEYKFASLQELKKQIELDCKMVKQHIFN